MLRWTLRHSCQERNRAVLRRSKMRWNSALPGPASSVSEHNFQSNSTERQEPKVQQSQSQLEHVNRMMTKFFADRKKNHKFIPPKPPTLDISTINRTLHRPPEETTVSALRHKFLPKPRGERLEGQFQKQQQHEKQQKHLEQLNNSIHRLKSNFEQNRNDADTSTEHWNKKEGQRNERQGSKNYETPLSEFIRNMQIKYEQESFSEKDVEFDFDAPRLPAWRFQKPEAPRELRRQMREAKFAQNNTSPLSFNVEEITSERDNQLENLRARRQPQDAKETTITLPSFDLTLAEASTTLRQKLSALREALTALGEDLPDSDLDTTYKIPADVLELVAIEFGLTTTRTDPEESSEDRLLQRRAEAADEQKVAHLPPRPPVVCIMGHVDHGKTTLMDALRRRSRKEQGTDDKLDKKKKKKDKKGGKEKSSSGDVAGTEAGGITQVISAFQVALANKPAVTFLDTPGHAAFRAMRQSGSEAADVIVLVVAADDGVSEQTVEILDFYKSIVKNSSEGGISLVVAMNKIDKYGIDVQESRRRIESQLLQHGILVEGMPPATSDEFFCGPPVQLIPISGLTGEGIDDLIDGLLLQSEVMDLRADDVARAEGIVMDARVDKGLGIVADCIIRWGSIQKGDIVVSGAHSCRVRMLKDVNNAQISKGLPSQPVRIIGFEDVPKAGDPIVCVESEEEANELIKRRNASQAKETELEPDPTPTVKLELQSAASHMLNESKKNELEAKLDLVTVDENPPIRIPVIIKADADGTLSAVCEAIMKIADTSAHKLLIDPIRVGVGPTLVSEVQMAKECDATILCFNIKNDQLLIRAADEENVPLIESKIIYSLMDMAKVSFGRYLPLKPVEVVHGRAKVQAVFDVGGVSTKVAGLRVLEGVLHKDKLPDTKGKVKCSYRVLRDGVLISPESLRATSLKQFKDDIESASKGKECGLSLEGFNELEPNDEIECFSVEMKAQTV